MLHPFSYGRHVWRMVISKELSIQGSHNHLVSQTTANADHTTILCHRQLPMRFPLLSNLLLHTPFSTQATDHTQLFFCTTKCLCLKYDSSSLYHVDRFVRIGMMQKAWQRVKEDTAWMWPLIKFLLGSASFMVWWAALRHWLPHMCSSRKQFCRTLRSVCAHTQCPIRCEKSHNIHSHALQKLVPGSVLDTVSMPVQCSECRPAASYSNSACLLCCHKVTRAEKPPASAVPFC